MPVNRTPVHRTICRRLDGIPPSGGNESKICGAGGTNFEKRKGLLTGSSHGPAAPTNPAALIDWSHELLSEPERSLLRRLSVFSNGWTFEAAEAVCSELDVLELLTQLVNKSLVTVDDEGQEPRYRLLETVRQYARDKLLEHGETEPARSALRLLLRLVTEIIEAAAFQRTQR
jgi:non-specific serine/threonine protein kinase